MPKSKQAASPWKNMIVALFALLLVGAIVYSFWINREQEARGVALAAVPGGDPIQGRVAIKAYGCGSCHTIPGIRGANGVVGPPLEEWARRKYIAGNLPNEPASLVLWIMNPQLIEPGTAMPNLNVGESDARDIAAYLATLD